MQTISTFVFQSRIVTKICINCQQTLPPDAKFCLHCGTPVPEELSPCPHCKEKNPAGSPLCYHCGRPLIKPDMIHLDHRSAFDLTGDADTINSALKGLFFKRLKTFVEDVLGNAHYSEYVDMYYASEMQKKFETKAKVIAESVVRHQASGTREDRIRSDSQVLHFLKSMVLYHVIVYGKAYHTCNLPEKILWYQDVAPGRLPLLEMIQDFLDLEREHLICYQDFIAMPVEKMKNAALSFLSAAPEEKVFFICDLSLFGNGKIGRAHV